MSSPRREGPTRDLRPHHRHAPLYGEPEVPHTGVSHVHSGRFVAIVSLADPDRSAPARMVAGVSAFGYSPRQGFRVFPMQHCHQWRVLVQNPPSLLFRAPCQPPGQFSHHCDDRFPGQFRFHTIFHNQKGWHQNTTFDSHHLPRGTPADSLRPRDASISRPDPHHD